MVLREVLKFRSFKASRSKPFTQKGDIITDTEVCDKVQGRAQDSKTLTGDHASDVYRNTCSQFISCWHSFGHQVFQAVCLEQDRIKTDKRKDTRMSHFLLNPHKTTSDHVTCLQPVGLTPSLVKYGNLLPILQHLWKGPYYNCTTLSCNDISFWWATYNLLLGSF